jgi:ABC-type antimicrobial peptide transport system permease subunit
MKEPVDRQLMIIFYLLAAFVALGMGGLGALVFLWLHAGA